MDRRKLIASGAAVALLALTAAAHEIAERPRTELSAAGAYALLATDGRLAATGELAKRAAAVRSGVLLDSTSAAPASPAGSSSVDEPEPPALRGPEVPRERIELTPLEPQPSPLGPVRGPDAPRWLVAALHVPPRPAPVDVPRPPDLAVAPDLTEKLVPPPLVPIGRAVPFPWVSRWRLAVPRTVAPAGVPRVC